MAINARPTAIITPPAVLDQASINGMPRDTATKPMLSMAIVFSP
ncbi:hypothetical protein [Vulcanisaeta sp. JCM 14467]|nr:hypothetical protein [Vulcanisaeta sp. JCM 14467]